MNRDEANTIELKEKLYNKYVIAFELSREFCGRLYMFYYDKETFYFLTGHKGSRESLYFY